jgi:UDP-N-acetylglucosamine 2-epimerase (non-hydrolysing)
MVVFGTRPEAIKLLPVIAALRARHLPTCICVTAQHRHLLDGVLAGQRLTPDIDLDLMVPGQSLPDMAGRMISALGQVFATEAPDRVIVQGDTATAAAAAYAAFLSRTPVAHVEAGLRTGTSEPFPEEGNRRVIAAVADMHFAPTKRAAAALLDEGVPSERIFVTGNTVVDALIAARTRLAAGETLPDEIVSIFQRAEGKRLVIVTCHRRENISRVGNIIAAVRELACRDDILIVLPAHPNPAFRSSLFQALDTEPNVVLTEPLEFLPFVALLSRAYLVLTDSGGVQEEAPVLGVPALILRQVTERQECVDAGTARLVGTNPVEIVQEVNRLLDHPLAHAHMARKHSPYGEGHASDRIADLLASAMPGEINRLNAGVA